MRYFLWELCAPSPFQAEEWSAPLRTTWRSLLFYRDHRCAGQESLSIRAAHLFSAGILIASSMMYLRVTVLLMLFNRTLFHILALPLVVLACIAAITGWSWSHLQKSSPAETGVEVEPRNPLEMRSALFFATLFIAVLVVSRLVLTSFRQHGNIWSREPYRTH